MSIGSLLQQRHHLHNTIITRGNLGDEMIRNTEWKRVYASLGVTVVCAIICIAAFTLMDGFEGGFAITFVTFFLVICGIAVAGLFVTRAREMDAIIENKRVLAHWVYREEDARQSADREFREYQDRNHAMFILIGGMLAVVALFFLIFVGEGGIETAAILFGVLVLLFIVSKIAPVLERRRAQKAPREAYIAENGIIYEGAIYPYRSFLMRKTVSGSSRQKKANLI